MGKGNPISLDIDDDPPEKSDGRARYPRALRHEAYSVIIEAARRLRPDVELALCLEEPSLWESTGLADRMGQCNCVL